MMYWYSPAVEEMCYLDVLIVQWSAWAAVDIALLVVALSVVVQVDSQGGLERSLLGQKVRGYMVLSERVVQVLVRH